MLGSRAFGVLSLVLCAACAACNRSSPDNEAAPRRYPNATPTTAAPPEPAAAAPDAQVDASTTASLHHVLGTGQSLANGTGGSPPLSTSQPYANRMFVTGPNAGASGLTSFVPLVEMSVETMSSGFANLVTKGARDSGKNHDLLVSVSALGGAPYRLMKKGTAPYAASMAQITAGLALSRAGGLAYDVTAVTSADGGGDHVDANMNLAADLAQWQRDFDADARAMTGQTTPVPLFLTQYSSWTEYGPTSFVPIAQLRAQVDNPGKVFVVGPRYAFLYGPDGVHLTNDGYRLMGEYYARAYRRVVVEHGTWEPLRPRSVTRATAVVTVRFHVPSPPLVFDTTRATDPGNLGFEYADDGGPASPTITSVAITGSDSVTITLSAEPTATNRRIRYAYTGVFRAKAGLQTGARGNLHDSDSTPSRNGYSLFNWCVHFDEAVP